MLKVPPGYDDLLGDAAAAPIRGELHKLDVEGVAALLARRPQPRSTAALAAATQRGSPPAEKVKHLHTFVCDHLEPGGFDALLIGMSLDELPADTFGLVTRALVTWGTARPYTAAATLASMTGHHWRTVRAHLINHGIADPMGLPSMHALLDITETMVIEAIQEDKPEKTRLKREQFYNQLYVPDRVAVSVDGKTKPALAEPEVAEEAFDQFARALGG